MAVARIAERHLSASARKAVEDLLRGDPDPKSNTFVTASAWADDAKSDQDAHWHYINYHFRTDGKSTDNKPLPENVVWAIERFSRELGDTSLPRERRRTALKYLIHFVGDVHQPLHAVARDTDQFPKGDRGGNDFRLIGPPGLSPAPRTLHFLWDLGGGLFPPIARPLNADRQAQLDRIVDDIARLHPKDSNPLERDLDPKVWAQESLFHAQRSVYNLEEQAVPSPLYLAHCQALSAQRASLAGYRLARLLNRILR